MKILIQNTTFYPEVGGVQRYLMEISKEFIKKGYSVSVLCSNPGNKLKSYEKYKGIEIIRYSQPNIPKKDRWKWPLFHEKEIERKLKELDRNFDLIIARNIVFVGPDKKFFDKDKIVYISPSVFEVYYHINVKKYDKKDRERYRLQKEIFKRLEQEGLKDIKIIALSKSVKNQLKKLYTISDKNIKVVNPGIRLNEFKVSNLNSGNVISVCRLSIEKNIDKLIESFRFVKNGRLFIVGGGSEFKNLDRKVKRLKLKNIKFLGQQKNPGKFLEKGSVFVLASDYEGFGHVFLEAMASGLPCIAFKPDGKKIITASNEIIKNRKTGFLVKDEKEMAEKINLLLEDKKLRIKMGKEARKLAKKYSWKKCVKGILN